LFSFEDAATGFVITPGSFVRATRASDGRSIRIEDRGGVALVVERAAADARG
jgi:hypothetical protein